MLTMSDPDGGGATGDGDGEGLLRPPPGHSTVGRMDYHAGPTTIAITTIEKTLCHITANESLYNLNSR